MFTALIYRDPLDVAEFLAYGSSPEERVISAEISARSLIEKVCQASPSIVRKGPVEVKKVNDQYLALFASGRFIFGSGIVDDCKRQANGIMEKYLLLKKNYEQRVKNT